MTIRQLINELEAYEYAHGPDKLVCIGDCNINCVNFIEYNDDFDLINIDSVEE